MQNIIYIISLLKNQSIGSIVKYVIYNNTKYWTHVVVYSSCSILCLPEMIGVSCTHAEIFSKSYCINPKSDCIYHFPDWFGSKQTSVWIQINRKMVNTIWFRVDLIRFQKDFSVCGSKGSCENARRKISTALILASTVREYQMMESLHRDFFPKSW